MFSASLLRERLPHGAARVSAIELFFDLVFVFAVTQLSHRLIAHFSPTGVLETLFLMLAVWWVWIFTAWVTNWLDPDRLPVRLCLLVLMLLGLTMSAALPEAFEDRALLFAGSYVAIQVGRTAFLLRAARGAAPALLRSFQRIAVWLGSAALLWLWGALDPAWRIPLWMAALSVEVAGPSVGFHVPVLGRSDPSDWQVAGAHLAERCAGFVILALGESILVTGATFAEQPMDRDGVLAFLVSFAGSVALWWLYFDTTSDIAAHRIADSADAGRLARLAYTYLHLPIVAGIILNAAGDRFVLARPDGPTDAATALCLLGGVGVYVLGLGLFKWVMIGRPPLSHGVAILLLLAIGPMVIGGSPIAASAVACAVLVALAIRERRVRRRFPVVLRSP